MNRQIYNLSKAVKNEITNFSENMASNNYIDYHLEQMLAKKMRFYLEYAYNLGLGNREPALDYAYKQESSRIRGMTADQIIFDECSPFKPEDPFEIQEIIDSL